MQLFHIGSNNVRIKGDNIEIFSVPEISFQLRKVFRVKKGDKICIQYSEDDRTIRYNLLIQDWTDKDLIGKIISSQIFSFSEKIVSMLIAMPNKWGKVELIVQKLTEIGAQNICFRVSEHSIIRQRNDKKTERLNKISHEALEQSRGIQVPGVKFINSKTELKNFIEGKNVILANMNGLSYLEINKDLSNNICGVVGPEGGFSEEDLKFFDDARVVGLGNSVLRMETASIALTRLLKNII